ncbi:DsrE family protein [Dechloromonas sp. ZY10]|uniref:DsrE family protein n=1 Tax=Dechloromonas aquae TaxID=2664436 RepID=UPI0035284EF0
MSEPARSQLAFLIWAATPAHPELIATPLVHALAGRALDAEVELHFAGPAVRWLVAGVAAAAYPAAGSDKSIAAFIAEAQQAGVRCYLCSMAAAQWIAADETLLAGVRHAGATAFVARSLDPAWKTQVF